MKMGKKFASKRKMFSAKGLSGISWDVRAERLRKNRAIEPDVIFDIQQDTNVICFSAYELKELPDVVKAITILRDECNTFLQKVVECTDWCETENKKDLDVEIADHKRGVEEA